MANKEAITQSNKPKENSVNEARIHNLKQAAVKTFEKQKTDGVISADQQYKGILGINKLTLATTKLSDVNKLKVLSAYVIKQNEINRAIQLSKVTKKTVQVNMEDLKNVFKTVGILAGGVALGVAVGAPALVAAAGIGVLLLTGCGATPNSSITSITTDSNGHTTIDSNINGQKTHTETNANNVSVVNGKVSTSGSNEQVSTLNSSLSEAEKSRGIIYDASFTFSRSSLANPMGFFEGGKTRVINPGESAPFQIQLDNDWFNQNDKDVKVTGSPTHITLFLTKDGNSWTKFQVPIDKNSHSANFTLPKEYFANYSACVVRAGFNGNKNSTNSDRMLFVKQGNKTLISATKNTLKLAELTGA